MSSGNKKKADMLGTSYGAARNKLHKRILFRLIQRLELDACFQCGAKIETENELSVEHKVPWLNSGKPVELFFDIDNIAFSHLKCNIMAHQMWNEGYVVIHPHGTADSYKTNGCRCAECREAQTVGMREYRSRSAN